MSLFYQDHDFGDTPPEDPRRHGIWIRLNEHEPYRVDGLITRDYLKLKKCNKAVVMYVKENLLHILEPDEKLESVHKSLDDVEFDSVMSTDGELDHAGNFITKINEKFGINNQCEHEFIEDYVNAPASESAEIDFRERLRVYRHKDALTDKYKGTANTNISTSIVNSPESEFCADSLTSASSIIVNENSENQENAKTSHTVQTKKVSAIWNHCKKIVIDKQTYLQCSYCGKKLVWQSNTTNMINHLSRKHPLFFNKDQNTTVQPVQEQNHHQAKKIRAIYGPSNTPEIKTIFQRMKNLEVGGSTYDEITNDVLFMICTDKMPISTVERLGFKYLMKKAYPLYKVPSRFTMTSRLEQKFLFMKQRIKQKVEMLDNYCITADNWTDQSRQSYIGVTVHYLESESLAFKKICLGCIPLYERHTADYLETRIRGIFQDFSIDINKINVMLTDSEPAIKKASTNIVGSKKYLACVVHGASHVLPDALKLEVKVQSLIDKVSNIVTLIRRCEPANTKLINSQVEDPSNKKVCTKEQALVLINDVMTRWTSTIDMVDRYIQLEPYIYTAMSECNKPIDILNREEVKILSDVLEIMKPFRTVITEMSGDKYPTCSLVIPLIHCLSITLDKYNPITSIGVSFKSIVQMKIKERFKNFEKSLILSCSTVLDPRFKKLHFEDPMAYTTALNEIDYLVKQLKLKATQINKTTKTTESATTKANNLWSAHDTLLDQQKEVPCELNDLSRDRELEMYLKLPYLARDNSNIFQYWRTEETKFPYLSKVAFQRLPALGTTVPSERQFSQAGLIDVPNRNKLSDMHLNMLTFLSSFSVEEWGLL